MVKTSGNDVRHRLLQCLTSRRAELFGRRSPHHAAAINHVLSILNHGNKKNYLTPHQTVGPLMLITLHSHRTSLRPSITFGVNSA